MISEWMLSVYMLSVIGEQIYCSFEDGMDGILTKSELMLLKYSQLIRLGLLNLVLAIMVLSIQANTTMD